MLGSQSIDARKCSEPQGSFPSFLLDLILHTGTGRLTAAREALGSITDDASFEKFKERCDELVAIISNRVLAFGFPSRSAVAYRYIQYHTYCTEIYVVR